MGKTEPMENLDNWTNGKLHQPLCTFKCRKVIMCECPCINVLSYRNILNVETEPRTKWCGDREAEPMEYLHLGNGISVSAIMKKLKNTCHFINMHLINFKLLNSPPPPKFESMVYPTSHLCVVLHFLIFKIVLSEGTKRHETFHIHFIKVYGCFSPCSKF